MKLAFFIEKVHLFFLCPEAVRIICHWVYELGQVRTNLGCASSLQGSTLVAYTLGLGFHIYKIVVIFHLVGTVCAE